MKFEVEYSGFVIKLKTRKFVINAKSEEEAAQKAHDKFWKVMNAMGYDGEGGAIDNMTNLDSD